MTTHDDHHDHHNHHDHGAHDHSHHAEAFKQRFFVSLILLIPILLLSPLIQQWLGVDWRFAGDSYWLFGLSTVLFIYGGQPFFSGAVDELRARTPAMMTLIALGITVAYAYSAATVFFIDGMDFFWEMASLIVIMLLGHWIEGRSITAASRSLEELAALLPDTAQVLEADGSISDRPVQELVPGDRVLVRPGAKIPMDGQIEQGDSEVDESMISGESVPVSKTVGDEVIGGSINGDGALTVEISRVGDESFLSQVIHLVQEAQGSRSRSQQLADRAAGWLFYIAVGAGLLTFIAWMLLDGDLGFAVERTVTVIIIACPASE